MIIGLLFIDSSFSLALIMDDLLDFSSDTYFMGEALRQARRAESQDEVPIGAVIVREAEIIARAWNQVEVLKDATAHAEMLAITQAESVVDDWRLDWRFTSLNWLAPLLIVSVKRRVLLHRHVGFATHSPVNDRVIGLLSRIPGLELVEGPAHPGHMCSALAPVPGGPGRRSP